jgi:hypothetical protein
MKRTRLPFIAISIVLLVAMAWLSVVRMNVNHRVGFLDEDRGSVPETVVPVRFTVLNNAQDVISARITILDLDGREVTTFERSLNGYDLVFEFAELKVGERYLPFLERISTDTGASFSAFRYYDSGGFPLIYRSGTASSRRTKEFSAAFIAAKTPLLLNSSKERIHHVSCKTGGFESDSSYSVVCTSDGQVRIDKDQ